MGQEEWKGERLEVQGREVRSCVLDIFSVKFLFEC